MMRAALALALVLLAAAFAGLSLGPLKNLWADYQDSPDSTYLLFGLPFVALAIGCLVGAVLVLRRR